MTAKIPFLRAHFRAMSQATEVEERVGRAMEFASGSDEISYEQTLGHFGNPITIFEAELAKAGGIRKFLERLKDAGILDKISGELDQRLDGECNFHLRLDKQKAYLEELALASGKDVIAVTLKVAAYPAKRENALEALSLWFEAL